MMDKKDYILEDEIFLYDEKVGQINKKHGRGEWDTSFTIECFDGYAVAHEECKSGEEPIFGAIFMTYPKMAELSAYEQTACLEYRGIETSKDKPHYGDVMMCFGVVKYIEEL